MYTHYSRITPPASALADRNDDIPRRWREKKSGALRKYFAAGLVAVVVLLAPAYTAAQTFTTIRNLTGAPNGSANPRRIIEGSNGSLYGVSAAGGLFNKGTVFKVDKDGANYVLLLSLNSPYSDRPYDIIEGSDGVLYGTTNGYDSTMLYRINKDGSGSGVLRLFTAAEGHFTGEGVIQGSDGALYGVLSGSGANTPGTLFKINHDGTGYTVLMNFTAATGAPQGGVIEGKDGLLYGAALGVYSVKKDGTGFTTLTTAFGAFGSLVDGSDGSLYGITAGYGSNAIVFTLKKDGSGGKIVATIPFSSGFSTGLTEGSDGQLYGTFQDANGSYGAWFTVKKDGSGLFLSYTYSPGINPDAGLFSASDGSLYGTTDGHFSGGFVSPDAHSLETQGTVFRITPASAPPVIPAGSLADAVADFVGIKGGNGWSYGLFEQYTPTIFRDAYYNYVPGLAFTAETQHPATANGEYFAAVRRWTSNYDGTVNVVGAFQIGHDGDGVGVSVLVDGVLMTPRTIIGNSGTTASQTFNFNQTVHKGSHIDFVVDPGPGLDANGDTTSLTAVISTTNAAPTPPAVMPPQYKSGDVLADSFQDFSLYQGAKGWWYFFNYSPGDSLITLDSNGTAWASYNNNYDSLLIDARTQHPSATNGIIQISAVRSWVSMYEGTVHVTGSFQIGHDGDGVGVQVQVDRAVAVSRTIIGNSGTSSILTFDFVQVVHVGTRLDFWVDPGPGRDYNGDSTQVAVVIKVQ